MAALVIEFATKNASILAFVLSLALLAAASTWASKRIQRSTARTAESNDDEAVGFEAFICSKYLNEIGYQGFEGDGDQNQSPRVEPI